MIVGNAAFGKKLFKSAPCKGTHHASVRIILNPRKKLGKVILHAAGPIFHSHFIFNGNNQIAVFLYMLLVNLQEILKGCLGRNVALPVFKNTDKKDIIIITGQHRFNIIEIAHINSHIIMLAVTVSVDKASFFGQIHTGYAACLFRQDTGNGAHAASHLKHLGILIHGKP